MLKEILFGAGGVSLVSLGILSVHWNIREVVAYKTGLGKKVRVVKAGSEQDEVKYRSNTLRPLGKVKFAEAALEEGKVEEDTSKKLEVAKEESYIYTQAVVGDLGDAIDDMLEKQKGSLGQGIVPEVEEDVLEDIDVEVYEGTQVLTVDDGHTTVLVEELEEVELTPTEHTQVLVEQEEVQTPLEHPQVLVENQEEVKEDKIDNENYFTEVLEQEPEVLENEVNYGTDILVSEHEGDISDEESKYLTEVLVEDEEIDVTEDVVVGDDLTDNDFEYITQVMVDTEESNEDYTTTVLVDDAVEEVVEDAAYETQVLVDEVDYHTTVLVEEDPDYNTTVLVEEDPDYNTTVLVEDEPDYNTTVLVAEEDYNTTVLGDEEDEYHTVAFEDDGTTGNVVGESVESAKTVGVEDIKVIYTNYELEEK